jgi:hypothetical protein
VITALKRSCLREQSATASERTRRAEEVKRREEAELLVTHLEHEREGWERERAMLIGEIKRLRGWELSEPTEGDDDKRIRRYTVGDVPPFRRFMPTQTRSLGLDSTLG